MALPKLSPIPPLKLPSLIPIAPGLKPSSPGSDHYSFAMLYDLLGSNGFKGDGLDIGAAVVMAESGGDAKNKHVNADGTVDRGLWMLNKFWHPEVSDACAYNAGCATRAAFKISKGGTDFSQWATYTNGAYKKFYKGKGGAAAASGAQTDSPLGNADDAVTGAISALTDPMQAIAGFVGTLFQASTWFRVGKVLLGGIVLIVVAYQLLR